ncbi:nickel pincer cofactor biosynthesis protein LarB [Labrys monachus]|uniref:NCAIR mutase (PurE)-related protein n=1 Tax=Labrys monachus TaxID=217067 RepID=A0ABU0FA64_9HYPH|nr:nickel pincer cofactor biosynthesis protein LarB [Labrys monachus]MDQ0391513.1 NCAIR mutase (PurE)-related protein [Labrys monachus]
MRETIASEEIRLDFQRAARIGLPEAIYCTGKSPAQIDAILAMAADKGRGLLLTRLDPAKRAQLRPEHGAAIDYCPVSGTGFFGPLPPEQGGAAVAIIAAGTSDVPVAREAQRVLRHAGRASNFIADVGVAGLWRLTERLEEIRAHAVVIVVAGMDAALASVVGGLVPGIVVCVPTSVGYGVAEGGHTALNAMLASCAPGITVCNIDNGYGAACAAIRALDSIEMQRRA